MTAKTYATIACALLATALAAPKPEVWTFDRLDKIGGHATTVVGAPKVIKTPLGKAVEFNGADALFIDNHPLAGAETFTWEVLFNPYHTGKPEQRFFHLSVLDPQTGKDTDDRVLFEIRIINNAWCLDSFAFSKGTQRALMDRAKLHPLDQWYHVAAVYDGSEFRNYIDGKLENKGPLHIDPQGKGHASAGVRINKVDYFTGAIRLARFSRTALKPEEFLKPPAKPAK